MALTEKHRNSIYQYLAPQWGDEVTQAFLSQFPAREGEEPITRDHLRAELGQLRTEMADLGGGLRTEMADLRGQLRNEMVTLRGEVTGEIAALHTDLKAQGSHLAGLVIKAAAVLATVIAVAASAVIALT